MTYLQEIVAKGLILVDAILQTLVNPVTYVPGNATACSPAFIFGNGLTQCGTNMVGQMGQLIVQGVGLVAGLLTALGASATP